MKLVKQETIAIPASTIPSEERKLGVQQHWHVCTKCKHPVTFGWTSPEAAKVIQEQEVPGVNFIGHDTWLGKEGFQTVFCRDCYTQAGYKACKSRRFKKMSNEWIKKQARGN